jgi:hypothetical protein
MTQSANLSRSLITLDANDHQPCLNALLSTVYVADCVIAGRLKIAFTVRSRRAIHFGLRAIFGPHSHTDYGSNGTVNQSQNRLSPTLRAKVCFRQGKSIHKVPEHVMQALKRYRWPGNICELQNFIERAPIITRGSVLDLPMAEFMTQPALRKCILVGNKSYYWKRSSQRQFWRLTWSHDSNRRAQN